ncbi:DUF488 domain-containing protein [Gardnerella vaginalis]|uniref:DUF488 domain-containing protein n=1 Tax=Gardnerella vaginalis TaxID=2702 RepID=UPI000353B441|nr:DUF488 domain-containing protein [Gardnerella vaginalis]EPI40835.1 hypothetical protein HMPREF1584_01458 [Gardnerella vaginalis JCP8481A]EPI42566.1 hypothetical protein HMPREF1585_00804 [Gardnerella vaginalis JCP8481B]
MCEKGINSNHIVQIKRVYECADNDDGFRILVDRLWPRGLSKERAHINEWCKDIAPTTELRRWFHHDSERFDEFSHRYVDELDANGEAVEHIIALCNQYSTITLVYAAKNPSINHALVLQHYLQNLLV